MRQLLLWLAIAAAVDQTVWTKVLPDNIAQHICPSTVENYNKCLVESVKKIAPLLVNGVRALNIPPLDPLFVPYTHVEEDLQVLQIKATTFNTTARGFSNMKLQRFRINSKEGLAEIRVRVPKLHLTTDYAVEGRFLLLSLDNEGYLDGIMDGFQGILRIALRRVTRDGVDYFALRVFEPVVTIENQNVHLKTKNPAEQAVVNNTVEFINNNQRISLQAFSPVMTAASKAIFGTMLERVLEKIPASELYP